MKKKKIKDLVDVLSHVLVPEMKVLSESEKKKILEKFEITEDQLPQLVSSDPAVVALKATTGDIVRIKREDPTGKYLAYKIIV